MSRSWEPLPKGFFQCPRMMYEEEEYLRKLARTSMKELIHMNTFMDPTIRWKATGDVDRVAMFQGDDVTATQLTYLCAKTEIRGTISEVAEMYFPDDEPLANLRRLFPDLLDAQTIHPLNLPSAKAPHHFIGIQWLLLEAPSALMKNRDFCVLECQDEFTDGTGRLGWARSLTSIKTSFCPDLDSSSGVVRGCMYRTGCIFVETELEGRLEATYFVQIDYRGQVPKAMQVSGMRHHIKSLALVESLILRHRLRQTPFLTESELVPKSARRACQVCKNNFGSFQRRRRCRKCGEVVCMNCSSHIHFDGTLDTALRLRVCSSCVLHVMLPNQFPNPLRSKSQRLHTQDTEDDVHFLFNSSKTPRLSKTPTSRRSQHERSYDDHKEGFSGWLAPKSPKLSTPGCDKKDKMKKTTSGNSIYAPRAPLEQPRTPRRESHRHSSSTKSNRSHRDVEEPIESSKHSRGSSSHSRQPSIEITPPKSHTSEEYLPEYGQVHVHPTSSSRQYRNVSQTPQEPLLARQNEMPPQSYGYAALSDDEEEDLNKYSIHGMMERQRVQLQRMQARMMPQNAPVPVYEDQDATGSDVFSICDTETMREFQHKPHPKTQMIDLTQPSWMGSIRGAPSMIEETKESPRFVELAGSDCLRLEEESNGDEPRNKPTAVQLDVDLAAVMKTMQSCLQSDGTFDLNAAASHSLLELYSKLKQMNLDQESQPTAAS